MLSITSTGRIRRERCKQAPRYVALEYYLLPRDTVSWYKCMLVFLFPPLFFSPAFPRSWYHSSGIGCTSRGAGGSHQSANPAWSNGMEDKEKLGKSKKENSNSAWGTFRGPVGITYHWQEGKS